MHESSTLVYLVHQIESEMLKLAGLRETEPDEQESAPSFSPSEASVQTILDYERLLQVEETESLGKIEWILN